jgi:L-ascorbate metabolism protein UlaG (beta-lactamase superfamily)
MAIGVTWLGHSTVVLDLDGVRLVADPLLQRHAGVLRRRGGRPHRQAWAGSDAVLLSHLHHDHAEVRSLRLLDGVPVLTAPANAAWVDRKGLDGRALAPTEWMDVGTDERGVSVRLVPAVHGARPMPHRPNAANGHLVRGPSGVVWVAGDTELYPDLGLLASWAGAPIDLAVVPIAGWGPRLSPGHLGPTEAAVACGMAGARWAVPVHWNTLHLPTTQRWPGGWMTTPGPAFVAALAREAPTCRALVLELGGSAQVPPTPDGPTTSTT